MSTFDAAHHAQLRTWMLAAAFVMALGCDQRAPTSAVGGASAALSVDELAKQCVLACPVRGIADGNASISGVTSVDTFFQAVLDYQAKANNVSGAIEAQLEAIRGDFGLAADADLSAALMEKIKASTQAGLSVDAEPARCTIDTETTIRTEAHCDASVQPGKVSCRCRGACELEAGAKTDCGAEAQLHCTKNAAMVRCDGLCQGHCATQLDTAGDCAGTCRGSCSGTCSAYVHDRDGKLQCAGKCDAQCTGRCDLELAAAAECKGMCNGECTAMAPNAKCEGAVRARCETTGDAMAECRGRCQGEIEPPKAKVECESSARAEAKLNTQCTPPRLAVKYALKSELDAATGAQFSAAADGLQSRLPALVAATGHANAIVQAQADLIGDGNAAVKTAIHEALSDTSMLPMKVVGLGCALEQIDDVGNAIDKASKRLSVSLDASTKLQAELMANNG